MWYIFPQFDGLGFSSSLKRCAIRSAAEAEATWPTPSSARAWWKSLRRQPVLGRSAFEVFGSPDDMKLRSCDAVC
jgi:uncharacterized protein (DUF1810 family)